MEAIIRSSNDAIVSTDLDGVITSWNPAAERITGYSAPEMIGRSIVELVPSERLAEMEALRERLGRGERVEGWETVRTVKEGRRIEISVTAYPIRDAAGEIIGFCNIVQDIGERKRSEENFRAILENVSDVVTILDADARIRYESRSLTRVLGYDSGETVGTEALAMLHPDDVASAREVWERAVQGIQMDSPIRFRRRHQDGTWRDFEATYGSRLDDPRIRGVIVISRDVTERQALEEARDRESRVSAALARVASELISSLDAPTLLERLCQLVTEVLQADYSQTWLWQPELEAFAPISSYGLSPERWEAIRMVRLSRAAVAGLAERLDRDDVLQLTEASSTHAILRALRVRDDVTRSLFIALRRGGDLIGAQTVGYVGRDPGFAPEQERIARGIGHLTSMALANARVVEELERANRLKSEFVSTMSHELRTPLNVIFGCVEMILDGLAPDDQADALGRIRRASTDLLEIVEATLDANRLASGIDAPRFERVALRPLWNELREAFVGLPRKPGVRLRFEPPGVPALRTDRRKLETILKNLLSNALKFTAEGEVELSCHEQGGTCVFAVRDTGIGIGSEQMPYIFDMFRQVDSSNTRSYGGVGLGLYIVRNLAQQLGGKVEVESELGRGSTFRVELPREPRAIRLPTESLDPPARRQRARAGRSRH